MKGSKALIWVLVLSNIALVVALIITGTPSPPEFNDTHGGPQGVHQPPHGPHNHPLDNDRMKAFMEDTLGFSQQDIDAFRQLRIQMDMDARTHHKAIKEAKTALFSLGLDTKPDSVKKDSLLAIICEEFKVLDAMSMEHFHQLSKLGTPENQEKLNRFLREMIGKLGPPHSMHKGKGH